MNPTGQQTSFRFGGDICSRKHGGNPQSRLANMLAEPHKRTARERVYSHIVLSGNKGMTCREIALAEGKEMHRISGRISELKAMGEIVETKRTRDGGTVLIASFIAVGHGSLGTGTDGQGEA